jgi:hypothetical protein
VTADPNRTRVCPVCGDSHCRRNIDSLAGLNRSAEAHADECYARANLNEAATFKAERDAALAACRDKDAALARAHASIARLVHFAEIPIVDMDRADEFERVLTEAATVLAGGKKP